jgi:hypothetical protein
MHKIELTTENLYILKHGAISFLNQVIYQFLFIDGSFEGPIRYASLEDVKEHILIGYPALFKLHDCLELRFPYFNSSSMLEEMVADIYQRTVYMLKRERGRTVVQSNPWGMTSADFNTEYEVEW